jgi:hypothetical protein
MEPTAEKRDCLFNWKSKHWPHEKLRKLIDRFESAGFAEDTWRCSAHRKIRAGDRAYLLKQPQPLGIFGRGHVSGIPVERRNVPKRQNVWAVPIQFDTSKDDVLFDPMKPFLVNEKQLFRLPAAQRFKFMQKSGERLDFKSAREIDKIIDSIVQGVSSSVADAAQEVARQKRIGEQAMRPDQQAFSETLRRLYGGTCAVTGCVTAAALEAAHICIKKAFDDNNP